jgi:hypothetical protein
MGLINRTVRAYYEGHEIVVSGGADNFAEAMTTFGIGGTNHFRLYIDGEMVDEQSMNGLLSEIAGSVMELHGRIPASGYGAPSIVTAKIKMGKFVYDIYVNGRLIHQEKGSLLGY